MAIYYLDVLESKRSSIKEAFLMLYVNTSVPVSSILANSLESCPVFYPTIVESIHPFFGYKIRLRGATVARLTPDQKVACSNHVVVKPFCISFFQNFKNTYLFGSWPALRRKQRCFNSTFFL